MQNLIGKSSSVILKSQNDFLLEMVTSIEDGGRAGIVAKVTYYIHITPGRLTLYSGNSLEDAVHQFNSFLTTNSFLNMVVGSSC